MPNSQTFPLMAVGGTIVVVHTKLCSNSLYLSCSRLSIDWVRILSLDHGVCASLQSSFVPLWALAALPRRSALVAEFCLAMAPAELSV